MAYQALYRKYRPRVFGDVVGQEAVTTPLRREVQNGTVAHAYLFTGSRGVGKTTCAKILAKAVNCPHAQNGDPCGICPVCVGIDDGSILDVTELDAASNNGVDDARALRAETAFTPVLTKYRVYIIDEAHMLSTAAANALLKIMEEPPGYVLFILATTEPHRLPATILSRCLRFDFKRIPPAVIAERLLRVASEEGFALTQDAALLIGRLSDGGMRDALSLLDICRAAHGEVTADAVARSAGLAGRESLFELTDALLARDVSGALGVVDRLYEASADIQRLCEELLEHFRDLAVLRASGGAQGLPGLPPQDLERLKAQAAAGGEGFFFAALSLLQETLGRLPRTASKRTEFEMALLRLCTPGLSGGREELLARVERLEAALSALTAGAPVIPAPAPAPVNVAPAPRAPRETPAAPPRAASPAAVEETAPRPFDGWAAVLERLADKSPMACANLRESEAYVQGGRVLIDAHNEMFAQFLQQNETAKEQIRQAIAEVTGRRYALGPYKAPPGPAAPESSDPLSALEKAARQAGIPIEINE